MFAPSLNLRAYQLGLGDVAQAERQEKVRVPGAKQTPGAGWWEVGSRHYKSKRALPSLQGSAKQVLEIYFIEISSPAALPPASSLPAQVYLQRGSYGE